MNAGSYQSVKISEIHLRDDVIKRAVSEEGVSKLALSMDVNGLQSAIRVRPLTVYKSGQPFQEWELIAGRHRVEAAKRLGWQDIDANVAYLNDNLAELAMIEENMARTDLEPAEFIYATARRKVLYEVEFPETKHGANQHTRSRHDGDSSTEGRFTKTAAEISGRGERTIQRAAAAGKAIGSIAPRLVGTSLNSITELEALAKLEDAPRKELIKRAIAGEKVSAKAAQPKCAPSKKKQTPANNNTPHAPIPMIDLTTPEHEGAMMTVGEAVAEAIFFPADDARGGQKDASRNDIATHEGTATISSPIVATIRAAEKEAISEARTLLDKFLGAFSCLDSDQRRECLTGRDLTELFNAYTS